VRCKKDREAGWDAAGAKAFGHPTFWVNRQSQPAEELGVVADYTGATLDDLIQRLDGETAKSRLAPDHGKPETGPDVHDARTARAVRL